MAATENDKKIAFEKALCDFESKRLYGNTPKPMDIEYFALRVRKGTVNLVPKYQRSYVWKEDKASRLVVTALCNRIVPGIVAHEREKGIWDIVDGKQRLTSLLSFYAAGGSDPGLLEKMCQQLDRQPDSMFKVLSKLDENYESLNGLSFSDLSEERQRALESYSIPCTIIPLDASKEEVFSCYEDINSGGEDLSAQQLRRAVFYGPYIELLDELALNENFQCIRDPEKFKKGTYSIDEKESDRELILRAFAWSRNHKAFKRPLKTFLNHELQHYEVSREDKIKEAKVKKELAKKKEEFEFVVKVCRNIFSESDGAFRVWSKQKNGSWGWNRTITVGMWDVMYLVLAELRQQYPTEPVYIRQKEKIQAAIKDLFTTGALDISGPISTQKFYERRNLLSRVLSDVLGNDGGGETRSFRLAQKEKVALFDNQGGLCAICGGTMDKTRLDDGSYVHVDHIHPFSKGGSTSLSNAALAHAACNQSKGSQIV